MNNMDLPTVNLVNVDEIPQKYRSVFQYPVFNKVQSIVFKDVLYSDKSVVLSAPTGSGKTVVLELAIVRLLMNLDELNYKGDFKIVYMAPVKALCTERLMDWHGKFTKIGLPCVEVTGDTDLLDISSLKNYKIIMTTPEKWDSLTRRWKDHEMVVQMVKLFLIDEVHLLKEEIRGPVLEAVVSRMKTIQETLNLSTRRPQRDDKTQDIVSALSLNIRFIAISATIPNAHDIAEWLGTKQQPAATYIIGEEYRPVKLVKIVEGFPCKDGLGLFKFDMGLSYKLRPIIEKYCEGKPTLIFCNTRKSVEMTADILSKELLFQFNEEQRNIFIEASSRISEKKLQALVRYGIGCHHAGFIQKDRNIIEDTFRQGDLPILITTSTLAMGVNLPAHLVIIKTTQYYNNGTYQDYEDSTVLQMMGRAGRPQFDTEGIAVIMTKNQDKGRYMSLVGGQRAIESTLHRHLSEHLNAEVALGTLPDILQAMNWIRSTFLYIRAVKNPTYYGFQAHNDRDTIEKRLEELCLKGMNALARAGMLVMDGDTCVESTEAGRIMAANCLDFETMKLIMKIKGTESLAEMIDIISKCHEFGDLPLRTGEKRVLNVLNKKIKGQDGSTCRFTQKGKIQSRDMKVNCLIQSLFGCLSIPDPSLYQELVKISRMGEHLSKCIMKFLTRPAYINSDEPVYNAVLNSVVLAKCFSVKLWENSPYFAKQFVGIGPALASLLASSGKTTFQSILESNPRDLERIMNKQPPAGNTLKRQVSLLPIYDMQVSFKQGRNLHLVLSILNREEINEGCSTAGQNHRISLIVGDSENNLLLYESISDFILLRNSISRNVTPKSKEEHIVYINCISHTWVGIDVNQEIQVKRSFNTILGPLQKNIMDYIQKSQNVTSKTKIKTPMSQKTNLTCDDTELKNTQKNCDKTVSIINNYIQRVLPNPNEMNTLSPNVSYYKPLPKQMLNHNKQDFKTPSEVYQQKDCIDDCYNNETQNKTFLSKTPAYLENFYSRYNENFDNTCNDLETVEESPEKYINGNNMNINKPSTSRREELCDMDVEYPNYNAASKAPMINDEFDSRRINNAINKEFDSRRINNEINEEFDMRRTSNAINEEFDRRRTSNAINEEFDSRRINNAFNEEFDGRRTNNAINEEFDSRRINNAELLNSTFQTCSNMTDIDLNQSDIYNSKLKSLKSSQNNTICTYYKQAKKQDGSPLYKKPRLDIQIIDPNNKQNDQNSEEIIPSSPFSKTNLKFTKCCTQKNKIEEQKFKASTCSVAINTMEFSKDTKDSCTNTTPDFKDIGDTTLPTEIDKEINVKENNMEVCIENQTENLSKNQNVHVQPNICFNFQININNAYNPILPEKRFDSSFNQTPENIANESLVENINKTVAKNICDITDDYKIKQFLERNAIENHKQKMNEVCQMKKIPLNIKMNFLNGINSVTDLSSSDFMKLYSIEKLNELQNNSIEKLNELPNDDLIQMNCSEITNESSNIIKKIDNIPESSTEFARYNDKREIVPTMNTMVEKSKPETCTIDKNELFKIMDEKSYKNIPQTLTVVSTKPNDSLYTKLENYAPSIFNNEYTSNSDKSEAFGIVNSKQDKNVPPFTHIGNVSLVSSMDKNRTEISTNNKTKNNENHKIIWTMDSNSGKNETTNSNNDGKKVQIMVMPENQDINMHEKGTKETVPIVDREFHRTEPATKTKEFLSSHDSENHSSNVQNSQWCIKEVVYKQDDNMVYENRERNIMSVEDDHRKEIIGKPLIGNEDKNYGISQTIHRISLTDTVEQMRSNINIDQKINFTSQSMKIFNESASTDISSQNKTNIASILMKYATNPILKPKLGATGIRTERRHFIDNYEDEDLIVSTIKPNTTTFMHQPSQDIIKCYQDKHEKRLTDQPTEKSYLHNIFFNTQKDDSPEESYQLTQANFDFCQNDFNEIDEDVLLNPQKVLASSYSNTKTEKMVETIMLDEDIPKNLYQNRFELNKENSNTMNTSTFSYLDTLHSQNQFLLSKNSHQKIQNMANSLPVNLADKFAPIGDRSKLSRKQINQHFRQFKNTNKNTFQL